MNQRVTSVYSVRSGPRQSNRRQGRSGKGTPQSYSAMVPTDQSAAIAVIKALASVISNRISMVVSS